VIRLKYDTGPLVRLNSCKVNSNIAVYSAAHLLYFCVLLQEHDEHDEHDEL